MMILSSSCAVAAAAVQLPRRPNAMFLIMSVFSCKADYIAL